MMANTNNTTKEPSLMECFAEQIPLLDFQLDDSPSFYHKLNIWSDKVKKGFEIFNGVADAYKAVCDATSNLHQAWEGMISQLDTSSQFLKKDDSFSPYSGVINTICDQMDEIQRYLKVRVDQMLDLTCNNLKRLDDERLKIEILDSQLKRTQETYFNALDKFGNLPIHDKNLLEFGESALSSRRNYYILIFKFVFSLREIYSTGIIEFAKNVVQDSLIHFTYYTHASNVYKNSESAIGEIDGQLRKAKIYCKEEIEADGKFHRLLREDVTNRFNFDSEGIKKLSVNLQTAVKVNKLELSSSTFASDDSSPILLRISRVGSSGRMTKNTDLDKTLKSPSLDEIHKINRSNTRFNQDEGKETKNNKSKPRKRTHTTVIYSDRAPDPSPSPHIPLSHSNSAFQYEEVATLPNRRLHKRFVHRINKRISTIISRPTEHNTAKASASSLDSKLPSITNKNLLLDEIIIDEDGTRSLTAISNLDSADESETPSPVKSVTFDPNNRFIDEDHHFPPLEITGPYNVTSAALHKLPSIDGDYTNTTEYLKRLNPLRSYLKSGYLRQKPKGNFALRTPKWPLVYCVIDKEEGWLRAGEMNGIGLFPLQNLMLSTIKKADEIDRIHCFKVVSPELEVTLQAFTPNEYKEWMGGLEEGIKYTIHNSHNVKWRSVKRNKGVSSHCCVYNNHTFYLINTCIFIRVIIACN